MGTNYFWHEENRCSLCGHAAVRKLHIGKASILSTWDEYQAKTARQQEAAQRAYEGVRRREREFQERFDKLNLSDAQLEADGYVRISLDALETRLRDEAAIGEQRDSSD